MLLTVVYATCAYQDQAQPGLLEKTTAPTEGLKRGDATWRSSKLRDNSPVYVREQTCRPSTAAAGKADECEYT